LQERARIEQEKAQLEKEKEEFEHRMQVEIFLHVLLLSNSVDSTARTARPCRGGQAGKGGGREQLDGERSNA